MKHLLIISVLVLLAVAAVAQTKPAANAQNKTILPDVFAGWQKSPGAQMSTDPAAADTVSAKVLSEYGLKDFESATYTRGDRKLTAKAIRFNDAGGSYGAFTFYKSPEMQTEKIGDQASSDNNRVLFYKGNVLVTVDLDKVTPMSAGELRELVDDLPQASGQAKNLPTLPLFLPRQEYVKNSVKYVVGPQGLASVGSPLTAQEIDFSSSPEVAVAQYSTDSGNATLELIGYPTPAIAAERLKALQSTHPEVATPDAQPFQLKRSGPLLAVVTGPITPLGAKNLIGFVHYDANVTWNQDTGLGKSGNVGSLLVSLVILTGVILGLALVAGLAFGGLRILARKFFPGRVFDRPKDIEFIELNLR
jgi:hypothetical protein